MTKSERLDQILLRKGWVTETQIAHALKQQKGIGEPFGSTLVVFGFITETQLAEALAEQYGTPKWDPQTAVVERRALDLFPESWVREHGVLPLSYDPVLGRLEIALTDPENVALLKEIRSRSGAESIVVAVVPKISLQRLWDRFYGGAKAVAPSPPRETKPVVLPSRTPASTAPKPAKEQPAPQSQEGPADGLGLEFSFSVTESVEPQAASEPAARVILWLSQPFVARLLRSLLESERCLVMEWNARGIPSGLWDYLVYDSDSLAAFPAGLGMIKRQWPQIQCVQRPSLATSLLNSPLSYERMRDGYVHLAEFALRRSGSEGYDRRFSRYTLAVARNLPLTPFEIDTLMVACEMQPFFNAACEVSPDWDSVADDLRSPFPVIDILRAVSQPFDQCGAQPGQTVPEAPLAARVFPIISAFLRYCDDKPVSSIDSLSELTEHFRSRAGKQFDPMVVEALLRVVREEVLEGCLPPGPSEVMLVSDHPVGWSGLRLQLENEGWRVVSANGAAEARDLAERRKPDAVIWAAGGAIEWINWQSRTLPGIANFLVLDEPNQSIARKALESGYEDVWSGQWDAGLAVAKMRRAVERTPSTTARPGMVTGSLEQLSFIDLIQVLTAGARSVAIEISHNSDTAKVVLWHGQIKQATAGGLSGEKAVHEVLSWDTGAFALRPVDAMPPANCRTSNDAMLLEGCRLMDERKNAPVNAIH
jgi:CheY-like chemotaxis protein